MEYPRSSREMRKDWSVEDWSKEEKYQEKQIWAKVYTSSMKHVGLIMHAY